MKKKNQATNVTYHIIKKTALKLKTTTTILSSGRRLKGEYLQVLKKFKIQDLLLKSFTKKMKKVFCRILERFKRKGPQLDTTVKLVALKVSIKTTKINIILKTVIEGHEQWYNLAHQAYQASLTNLSAAKYNYQFQQDFQILQFNFMISFRTMKLYMSDPSLLTQPS